MPDRARKRPLRACPALLLLACAACVTPRTPAVPENERDPEEVRQEREMTGAGKLLEALAGFASKSL